MIRLSAIVSDHGFTYTLAREGVLIFTTGNRAELVGKMLALGIDNPEQLIQAAEQWAVVEIR